LYKTLAELLFKVQKLQLFYAVNKMCNTTAELVFKMQQQYGHISISRKSVHLRMLLNKDKTKLTVTCSVWTDTKNVLYISVF